MSIRFVVNQKDIISLLASMQPICNKKTSVDITQSILFDVSKNELILKATDLQISLRSSMSIQSNAIDNIQFLISGKRIFEIIKDIEDDIQFIISENNLKLKTDNLDLSLHIQDANQFPAFPERIENLTQIDTLHFKEIINKVSFLIPQNNSNVALNGMLLEMNENGLNLVATDAHRLIKIHTNKYNLSEYRQWLLPKRAVVELKKILDETPGEYIFLGTCGNSLVFSGDNFNFFTKLIADPFPHYQPILNKEGFYSGKIVRGEFIKSLKRTIPFLGGKFISTEFNFLKDSLTIFLRNDEIGEIKDFVDTQDFNGKNITTKFYTPYVISGLQIYNGKIIDFYIKDSTTPLLFEERDIDSNYEILYLIMPVSM